jgi:hypothetical protein
LPPGVKFTPRGELGPQGWTLSPRGNVHPFVHPQGWTLFTVSKNGGANREFPPRGYLHPRPQGTKFTPGGQLHPWGQSLPLGAKLRMGLRPCTRHYIQTLCSISGAQCFENKMGPYKHIVLCKRFCWLPQCSQMVLLHTKKLVFVHFEDLR